MPLPAAEVDVTPRLVRALLDEQHPDLAALPLHELASGWDNVIYRLGDALTVRLPRRSASAVLILHEQRWLPQLAADLPLPVPAPVRIGVPGCGFPWAWSVAPWLPGVEIERASPTDWTDTAGQLGTFLAVLHRPAPPEAPTNPYRGVPLDHRAERFAEGLEQVVGADLDRSRLAACFAEALDARPWSAPPVWLHGDLHPLNVLVNRGRLSAIIDFGDITAGDPASDLAVAWMLLPPEVRPIFRSACGARHPVDDDLWARARGWTLALGVALANGDDRVSTIGRRTLAAVLADQS